MTMTFVVSNASCVVTDPDMRSLTLADIDGFIFTHPDHEEWHAANFVTDGRWLDDHDSRRADVCFARAWFMDRDDTLHYVAGDTKDDVATALLALQRAYGPPVGVGVVVGNTAVWTVAVDWVGELSALVG